MGATTLTAPKEQHLAANSLQVAQPGPPPKRQTSVLLSLLPEQEGCSFNLNNCCQGFIGDSLVSKTGSLVSRGLSGEWLPAPCCQGTSTGGTFCTSFCSFLSPFVFQNTHPGSADPLHASQLCGCRWGACAWGCAVCTPKGLCSAVASGLLCLCSLFQQS